MNIGFIGTGIMGKPMAQNLQKAGHTLRFSEHFEPAPHDLLGENGIACPTPCDVAKASDIIIIMLPDTPHVEDVLFHNEYGIINGLEDGKIVVDMSSISPIATKEFAHKVARAGAEYIDAPVSGGEVGAIAGTLSIMAGGNEQIFNKVKPLFEVMGKNITLVGSVGDGQVCKVANQIIVALNIEAVAEALLFAAKSGADPSRVRQALMGGFASSRVLEVHGERMIKGSFEPGFRINLHQKDLNLALENARQLHLSLPATAMAQQLFNSCTAMGGGNWDHSAMINALENMADFSIRQ
ncbi:2-hydroxy-3-oxopropionate reductase [Citrobacter sp. NCU1]|uniref:2-hydroxy-3-oxopropionate reductase n=1 Tax=Citrobacter sp. NCU1 TaxID=2026683 RepID=UPI001390BFAA|nr:2-hydroxy-3-oxopropionate reductase [Citrobacter sp. NCU1]NDO79642.1 2-hydroxy-3-oxopropionate reductase [Citrobacter sp. NCU1]